MKRLLLCSLVLSGFAGLSYELLWVRMLSFSFGSTTSALSAVLAVFFGGIALGSWLATKLLFRISRPLRCYGLVEIAIGICGIALYPVLIHLGD